ncbi:hypothetical protein B0H13DRAFT_126691 [Mycena leptocephala]|nr:hypothetical protein B0H13DRAFT_126691 [Mycena leptocephala]
METSSPRTGTLWLIAWSQILHLLSSVPLFEALVGVLIPTICVRTVHACWPFTLDQVVSLMKSRSLPRPVETMIFVLLGDNKSRIHRSNRFLNTWRNIGRFRCVPERSDY